MRNQDDDAYVSAGQKMQFLPTPPAFGAPGWVIPLKFHQDLRPGLHPIQNLLLIVYDHINYDLHDYSASIWAKQQEVCDVPRARALD